MQWARFILGGVLAVVGGWAAVAEAVGPAYRSADLGVAAEPLAPVDALRPHMRPVRVGVLSGSLLRPMARQEVLPTALWDSRGDTEGWTSATLVALTTDAAALDDVVPRDIAQWCPTYPDNPPALRRAFWVGMMSALAHHESTLNPRAVGGGGRWFGLLQIAPPTARLYACAARTGDALRDPVANLACAARIMAVTVARDQAVALHDGRWRGVAADWGPMTSAAKRAEMSAWTREQAYCRPVTAVETALRPPARPVPVVPAWDTIRLAQL